MDEYAKAKLYCDVTEAAQYALNNVSKKYLKEEYYERLLHNRLGKNYESVVAENSVEHDVIGKVADPPDIFKPLSHWSTDLTPDIHLKVKNADVFIEVKLIHRKYVQVNKATETEKAKWELKGFKYVYTSALDCYSNNIEANNIAVFDIGSLLPLTDKEPESKLFYTLGVACERFFFDEGQLWADIVRILCINKADIFYMVLYVLDISVEPNVLENRLSVIIKNLLHQQQPYSICCYSKKSQRYVKQESYPYIKEYIKVDGKVDESDCIWIDKLTTDPEIKCKLNMLKAIKNNKSDYAVVIELEKYT